MSELSVAVRTVHYAAVMLLFGGFVFLLGVARPVYRQAAGAILPERRELHRWLIRVLGLSLAAVLASGVLWFLVEASNMSGLPLDRVLNRQTLGAVLNDTLFGRIWEIRLGLAIVLGAFLLSVRRPADDRSWLTLGAGGGLLAGGLLAMLAWAGHAAAEQGSDRYVHLAADAAHLLAAGTWLGALPPLVFVLAHARHATASSVHRMAARMTQRFSTLGVLSVGCLVLTGGVNSWYLLGGLPGLFATHYGHLLLLKLALFGLMVTLAAVNRLRLMPELLAAAPAPDRSPPAALRWLWRNAILETALGLTIVSIVGVLGVTIPAAHVQPVWPFPFTLSWARVEESAGLRLLMFAAGTVGFVAAGLAALGARIHRRWVAVMGLAGIGGTLAIYAWLLSVPAYPSTYFRSPARYTTASIARGAPLFAEHCVVCHGPYGYGDGPAAALLPTKPANLTEEHLFHHREGDLFWWLTRGISGTPMPGFGDRMSEAERWDLINFLRAQAEAEEGRAMDDKVEPWRPIVAPDFTFQIDHHQQESLKQLRGRSIVLLVLCTLPESLARLRVLTESRDELGRAGVRIVAVPMNKATAVSQDTNTQGPDASIMAASNPHLVAAYTLFRRTTSAERVLPAPAHMEFLIDRQGYLRARWRSTARLGWDRMPDLFEQIEVLNREKPRAMAPEHHVH